MEQGAVKEHRGPATTARPATAPAKPTAVFAAGGEKLEPEKDAAVQRQPEQSGTEHTPCKVEPVEQSLEMLPVIGRNDVGSSATGVAGGDSFGPKTSKDGGVTCAIEQVKERGNASFRSEGCEHDRRSGFTRPKSAHLSVHTQPTENKELTAASLTAMDVAVSVPLTTTSVVEANPTASNTGMRESLQGRVDSPLYRDMRLLEDSERRKALLRQLLTNGDGCAAMGSAESEGRAMEPGVAASSGRSRHSKIIAERERSGAGASLGEFKVDRQTIGGPGKKNKGLLFDCCKKSRTNTGIPLFVVFYINGMLSSILPPRRDVPIE